MPELPEVESVRQGLESVLGQQILSIQLGQPHCIKSLVPLKSKDLHLLKGQTIHAIERKGKFLRITLDRDHLLVHLGMSGVLLYQAPERPHTHISITIKDGVLRYSDPRRFGHWELQDLKTPLDSWEKLGPDALDPTLKAMDLWGKTKNSRRDAKDLLLDQSLIAGIGNIYACEALFMAGAHPERRGFELEIQDWERLLQHARKIMELSIQHKGTTFSDYRLTNGKGGSFQEFLQVFQKEGQDCPKCQNPITKLTQKARSTFYCATCQT